MSAAATHYGNKVGNAPRDIYGYSAEHGMPAPAEDSRKMYSTTNLSASKRGRANLMYSRGASKRSSASLAVKILNRASKRRGGGDNHMGEMAGLTEKVKHFVPRMRYDSALLNYHGGTNGGATGGLPTGRALFHHQMEDILRRGPSGKHLSGVLR